MIRLLARDVAHRFGGTEALRGVTLEVAPGSFLALVGESGSGKTTLLRCFNRMIEPTAGEVFVDDVPVRTHDRFALRRRLGYVQQHGGLLPHWSVAENVGLVLRAMGRSDPRAVAAAMARVGLRPETFGGRFPRELSGGERQRVALARALAGKPDAILLDEPFGALDAITRAEVQDAFAAARDELRLTTVLVTHDLAEAARLADEIVVLRAGRIEQRGSMAALRDAPATEYVATLVARAMAQSSALRPATA